MSSIITHPLREGVALILNKHFAPEIVKKFKLELEANIFDTVNTKRQLRDDHVAMEVRYQEGDTIEFICDVWSHWKPSMVEHQLLKMITDKARTGVIGKNWTIDDKGRFSEEFTSGKFETPDSLIEKGMA